MKLDHQYQKRILESFEELPKHQVKMSDIAGTLDIDLNNNDANKDKFIGHIRLLDDVGCIDSYPENLGIKYDFHSDSGYIVNKGAILRLTNTGYEYLSVLRNDSILSKLKNLSINLFMAIGKQMLLQQAVGMLP